MARRARASVAAVKGFTADQPDRAYTGDGMARTGYTFGRRSFFRGGLALAGLSVGAACGAVASPNPEPTSIRRIGYFASSPPNPETWGAFPQGMRELQLASSLGLASAFEGVGSVGELNRAFEAATSLRSDAVLILLRPVLSDNLTRTAELALRSRLPSMWQSTEGVRRGGFLGYGPDRADLARRAAPFVDRILNGASPANIPVQYPNLFEFVVNLKTARAFGLTIPTAVLQQATEVIQ